LKLTLTIGNYIYH